MSKINKFFFILSALVMVAALFPYKANPLIKKAEAGTTLFTYNCSVEGRLQETGSMSSTTSPYWWLNSGGYMYLSGGVCKTVQGELPVSDFWRLLYNRNNPTDTDEGFHPQNIFRLVTKQKFGGDISQKISFNATTMNLSDSMERNAWSGVLLFNRYQDGNNLYYAGIRDDGHAVIKSKKNGAYTTLAEAPYFSGTYNRITNPTLLPFQEWMAIKTEIITNDDETVTIKLYVDNNNDGNWKLAVSATDKNNPILNAGYAGLRLDYRDALFDSYQISTLN